VSGGSKLKLTAEQQAKAENLQSLSQVLNMIMNSNYSSDVKLDALLNLSNAVKNDGNLFNQATAQDMTDINISNDTNIKSITNLNNNLRIISEVIAENEMILDGIEVTNNAEADLKFVQAANSASQQIQDLVNDTKDSISAEDKKAISDEIEKSISSESTGIAKGLADSLNPTKYIIIIIVVIVGLIIIFGGFFIVKKMIGGNDRFLDDDYDL
jgi:hypothetical protein